MVISIPQPHTFIELGATHFNKCHSWVSFKVLFLYEIKGVEIERLLLLFILRTEQCLEERRVETTSNTILLLKISKAITAQ
jgi:hypothetical protein